MVYEEFLHTYIDQSIMDHLDTASFSTRLNPVAYNEFGAAVFRTLHSIIPTSIQLISANDEVEVVKLHDIVNDMQMIRSQYDDIARGLLMQPVNIKGYDPGLFHGLRLFSNVSGPGIDLISVDLNRGRDHGIPPYVNFLRDFQGGVPIRKFKDLSPYISDDNIRLLMQTYESVEDIDLLVGTILEVPMSGCLLGPTAQMMFYSQFKNLRAADPYFYINPNSPNPFTKRQLVEIFKASTHQLFCANTGVNWVPRTPSRSRKSAGGIIDCDSLPRVSYESWREN